MTWFHRIALPVAVLVLASAPAEAARQAPDPQEVYELIRTNLPGLTDAQLQTAAVEGLIQQLEPRVWLVDEAAASNSNPAGPVVSQASVFDGPVAYLRIARVGDDLAAKLHSAYADLSRTNQFKGLVLDLRFAGGDDYAAVGPAANLFVSADRPLLDWGDGSVRTTENTNALRLPVAVLVNHQTVAAAEALAAVLRDAGVALILGTNTAGKAVVAKDFRLKNGEVLRIAGAGVKLGSGAVLSSAGVKPDIEVAVSASAEKAYRGDPFKDLSNTNVTLAATGGGTNGVAGTNRPMRRPMNEAELIRERRDGMDLAADYEDTAPADSGPPAVHDPVLARALDLIKGLAVVQQMRDR